MTTAASIKIDDELKQRVQQIAATRQRSDALDYARGYP